MDLSRFQLSRRPFDPSDGREAYPEYFKIDKPDRPNVEPFRPLIKTLNEVTALKWAGDLRICKPRKNHKLQPFKYKEFEKESTDGDAAKKDGRTKDKKKAGGPAAQKA